MSPIGLVTILLALTTVVNCQLDARKSWFKRPKEALPAVCSEDKTKNKIVPIVIPIFSNKYALKISIAYEIPGEETDARLSAETSSTASSRTDIGGLTGRKLLQQHEDTHGAYFSVNLEKIDGQEVVEFGNNVKLNGYKGVDGRQYELVTPEEGSTVLQNVGLWGVHKNRCGFAASVDIAVPTSGTLSLQVKDPENPTADPEYVDLDVHVDRGVLTQFGTAIDHLSCVAVNDTSLAVFLDGPEINHQGDAYRVEVEGQYNLYIRPKGVDNALEAAQEIYGSVDFEVLFFYHGKLLKGKSVQRIPEADEGVGYSLFFEETGAYRLVLTARSKYTGKKLCVRIYDFQAVKNPMPPILQEIDTEHEEIFGLCYCDPTSKFYGPWSQECNTGIRSFCKSHHHNPACHPGNIQKTLDHSRPWDLLVRYDFSSFLSIVCPSRISKPPKKTTNRVARTEKDTLCELYALQMSVGGNSIPFPATNSNSALVFVACDGPAGTHLTPESFNVVLLNAKNSYEKGRVEKVVKRVDIPGTFIVTVHTPYTYKGFVILSVDDRFHLKGAPLKYVVKEHIPLVSRGFYVSENIQLAKISHGFGTDHTKGQKKDLTLSPY